MNHFIRILVRIFPLALFAVLLSGCVITPHANIGMDLNYHGGEFHLQPTAHIGVSGRP